MYLFEFWQNNLNKKEKELIEEKTIEYKIDREDKIKLQKQDTYLSEEQRSRRSSDYTLQPRSLELLRGYAAKNPKLAVVNENPESEFSKESSKHSLNKHNRKTDTMEFSSENRDTSHHDYSPQDIDEFYDATPKDSACKNQNEIKNDLLSTRKIPEEDGKEDAQLHFGASANKNVNAHILLSNKKGSGQKTNVPEKTFEVSFAENLMQRKLTENESNSKIRARKSDELSQEKADMIYDSDNNDEFNEDEYNSEDIENPKLIQSKKSMNSKVNSIFPHYFEVNTNMISKEIEQDSGFPCDHPLTPRDCDQHFEFENQMQDKFQVELRKLNFDKKSKQELKGNETLKCPNILNIDKPDKCKSKNMNQQEIKQIQNQSKFGTYCNKSSIESAEPMEVYLKPAIGNIISFSNLSDNQIMAPQNIKNCVEKIEHLIPFHQIENKFKLNQTSKDFDPRFTPDFQEKQGTYNLPKFESNGNQKNPTTAQRVLPPKTKGKNLNFDVFESSGSEKTKKEQKDPSSMFKVDGFDFNFELVDALLKNVKNKNNDEQNDNTHDEQSQKQTNEDSKSQNWMIKDNTSPSKTSEKYNVCVLDGFASQNHISKLAETRMTNFDKIVNKPQNQIIDSTNIITNIQNNKLQSIFLKHTDKQKTEFDDQNPIKMKNRNIGNSFHVICEEDSPKINSQTNNFTTKLPNNQFNFQNGDEFIQNKITEIKNRENLSDGKTQNTVNLFFEKHENENEKLGYQNETTKIVNNATDKKKEEEGVYGIQPSEVVTQPIVPNQKNHRYSEKSIRKSLAQSGFNSKLSDSRSSSGNSNSSINKSVSNEYQKQTKKVVPNEDLCVIEPTTEKMSIKMSDISEWYRNNSQRILSKDSVNSVEIQSSIFRQKLTELAKNPIDFCKTDSNPFSNSTKDQFIKFNEEIDKNKIFKKHDSKINEIKTLNSENNCSQHITDISSFSNLPDSNKIGLQKKEFSFVNLDVQKHSFSNKNLQDQKPIFEHIQTVPNEIRHSNYDIRPDLSSCTTTSNLKNKVERTTPHEFTKFIDKNEDYDCEDNFENNTNEFQESILRKRENEHVNFWNRNLPKEVHKIQIENKNQLQFNSNKFDFKSQKSQNKYVKNRANYDFDDDVSENEINVCKQENRFDSKHQSQQNQLFLNEKNESKSVKIQFRSNFVPDFDNQTKIIPSQKHKANEIQSESGSPGAAKANENNHNKTDKIFTKASEFQTIEKSISDNLANFKTDWKLNMELDALNERIANEELEKIEKSQRVKSVIQKCRNPKVEENVSIEFSQNRKSKFNKNEHQTTKQPTTRFSNFKLEKLIEKELESLDKQTELNYSKDESRLDYKPINEVDSLTDKMMKEMEIGKTKLLTFQNKLNKTKQNQTNKFINFEPFKEKEMNFKTTEFPLKENLESRKFDLFLTDHSAKECTANESQTKTNVYSVYPYLGKKEVFNGRVVQKKLSLLEANKKLEFEKSFQKESKVKAERNGINKC